MYVPPNMRILTLVVLFASFFGTAIYSSLSINVLAAQVLEIVITPSDVILQGGRIRIDSVRLNGVEIVGRLTENNFKLETDETHSVSKFDAGTKTFSINGKATDAKLIFTFVDDQNTSHVSAEMIIKVKSALDDKTIRITEVTSGKSISFGSELKMLSGDEKTLKIEVKDKSGDNFENPQIKISSENEGAIRVLDGDLIPQQTKLIAQKIEGEQISKIRVGTHGVFTIKVFDKVTADSIELTDGPNKIDGGVGATSIVLRGEPKSFGLRIKNYRTEEIPGGRIAAISGNENLVKAEVRNNLLILTPQQLPPRIMSPDNLKTTISISVTQADAEAVSQVFSVQLTQQTRFITVNPNPVVLPKDSNQPVTATIKRISDQAEINDAVVSWDYEVPADKEWITLTKQGKKATVIWKETNSSKVRPPSVNIKVVTTGDDGQLISEIVAVKMVEITQFAKLKVKLNVLDKRTVRDLFGSTTESEYYVVSVRMYNNLKDEKRDEYIGASILVYNGSFEVAVLLQKLFDKGSRSGNLGKSDNKPDSYQSDGKWYDLTVQDLMGIRATTGDYVRDERFKPETLPVIGYGEEIPDPPCQGTLTYRPLTFEMAVNTVDARDSRRTRSRIFAGLSLAATGTSFLSATNILTGKDVVPILDKFSNLLLPGMEKIFPSLKEVHRQNVVSMAMKPIEEIPFGTDLTRVVLIPKKSIRGILQDHKVRISQICPYYFRVEVAVIKRGDRTEVQQGEQQ